MRFPAQVIQCSADLCPNEKNPEVVDYYRYDGFKLINIYSIDVCIYCAGFCYQFICLCEYLQETPVVSDELQKLELLPQ